MDCLKEGKVCINEFEDMLKRYYEFKEKYNRPPLYVEIKAKKENTDGWVLTGFFLRDMQDTGYTCGPSSLQMALSALGCNVDESQLMKWAGTTTSGTTYEGLRKAVEKAGEHCNMVLKYSNVAKANMSWNGVANLIKEGKEIIIHVVTLPGLEFDVNGRRIWKNAYGHYIYLVGVNTQLKRVRVADPSKGIVDFSFEAIEQAIRNVTWGNSLHIIEKLMLKSS